jgi:hypothetical protein
MEPGKAEAAGYGGPMFKAGNTVWLHFSRNPERRETFRRSHCRSSLMDVQCTSLFASRAPRKLLPSLPRYKLRTGSSTP